MQSSIITSTANPLGHTKWGTGCEAFTLLETAGLSIKQELMPPGTEEVLHYHTTAQQYFYILSGEAVFEINGVIVLVHSGEGIHIPPGSHHRIMNKHTEALEFLVCAQPSTLNDRFNLA